MQLVRWEFADDTLGAGFDMFEDTVKLRKAGFTGMVRLIMACCGLRLHRTTCSCTTSCMSAHQQDNHSGHSSVPLRYWQALLCTAFCVLP